MYKEQTVLVGLKQMSLFGALMMTQFDRKWLEKKRGKKN